METVSLVAFATAAVADTQHPRYAGVVILRLFGHLVDDERPIGAPVVAREVLHVFYDRFDRAGVDVEDSDRTGVVTAFYVR